MGIVLNWNRRRGLQLCAVRLLRAREKCQRQRALATELERAEILVPWAMRPFWFGALPVIQLLEIGGADRAVLHSLHEVQQYGWG